MYYPEIIHEVKAKGYYAAVTAKEIRAEYERLLRIRESDLLDENLHTRRSVRALLEAKYAVVEFIERGMRAEDLPDFTLVMDRCKVMYRAAQLELDPDAPESDASFDAITAAIGRLVIMVQGINADVDALLKGGEYVGTIADFTRLRDKYSSLNPEVIGDLFPEIKKGSFKFPSVRKAVFDLLIRRLNEVMDAMFADFSVEGGHILDTLSQYDRLQSVPSLSLAQGIKDAPVLFVCTPIRTEFDIMLNANLHRNGIERIVQIDLSKLPKKSVAKSADSIARYLFYLKKKRDPNVIAFYGIEALSEEERRNVYAAVTSYLGLVAEDVRMVFMDVSGDMQGMTEYDRLRGKGGSYVPAENRYLRLPSYSDACDLLADADEKTREEVRVGCVFMGYLGLNYFYAEERELGLAIDTAKSISEQNAAKVLSFLARLPDDSKLVPLDWRYDPAIEKSVRSGNGEYDYDEIRDVSDDRIRAIISNESYSIYEKCGELVRYILLADEDRSVWKEVLSEDARRERIERATRIIAYTMKVYHSNPKVTIVDTRSGGWGGMCCNGGAEIKYKKSSSEDIAWLEDAILHELYHSLQHTLTDTMVDPTWYKKVYHISNERIASWNDNNGVYISIDEGQDKVYMIQALEVDARDFAGLCLGDQVYHDHDKIGGKRGKE